MVARREANDEQTFAPTNVGRQLPRQLRGVRTGGAAWPNRGRWVATECMIQGRPAVTSSFDEVTR